MRYLICVAMLMGLASSRAAAMPNNHCSTDMYQRADASLLEAAAGWGSLLRHQKAFGACDDGALAEGYSDAVVTLLANRWDQFYAFVILSARNPAFRRWAVRHVDASASTDDLKKVARNAARCSGNAEAKDLCGEVGKAARNALKD